MFLAGALPGAHAPNASSSAGSTFCIVVSPTTMTCALPGLNHCACQRARSSRVTASTDLSVPEPESGMP
jgi:hypothetical protein